MTEASKPEDSWTGPRRSLAKRAMDHIPHTSSAGPATSQDAGDAHTDSGKRQTNAMRVLRMVYNRGLETAWTATEFHKWQSVSDGTKPPLNLTEIRRRLTDLQALNYVKKGERKGREYSWRITTAGKLALSVAEGKGRR